MSHHFGNWIRFISVSTNVIAKLLVLLDGLMLAIRLDISFLEVELDAKIIIDLVNYWSDTNRAYSSLPTNCRSLLIRLQQVKMSHVYWELNKCTNILTKKTVLFMRIFFFLIFKFFYFHPLCGHNRLGEYASTEWIEVEKRWNHHLD